MDLPGTARLPFLLLETIKDLEGEHLRVAKGRSSPSPPLLGPAGGGAGGDGERDWVEMQGDELR